MPRLLVSISGLSLAMIFVLGLFAPPARSESCEKVVAALNAPLKAEDKIDEPELVATLRNLNRTGNTRLPPQFITKKQARTAGWRPGSDLWRSWRLKGKSVGGDRFMDREGKLPDGGRNWREADLDYKGGARGAKRLIYSNDGLRMVTVDHYRTFTEVPACE